MAPERTLSETSPLLGARDGNPSLGAIADQGETAETGLPTEDQAKQSSQDAPQLKYIVPAISIGVC